MAEYTPGEGTVREQYSREQPPHIGTVGEKRAEFDRFLTRVRRDAAREALDGLAMRFGRMGDYADLADQPGRPFWEAQDEAEEYRDEFYPEEPQ